MARDILLIEISIIYVFRIIFSILIENASWLRTVLQALLAILTQSTVIPAIICFPSLIIQSVLMYQIVIAEV